VEGRGIDGPPPAIASLHVFAQPKLRGLWLDDGNDRTAPLPEPRELVRCPQHADVNPSSTLPQKKR